MSTAELRDLLKSATDESQHVVVLFLDVRGFSSFAKIAQSADAADFLKSVYGTILDEYVPDATYAKLTGDGMLVVFEFERESLQNTIRSATDISLRLVENFPAICDDDPMVNFDVPTELGVGLARGTVTCLKSGNTILDYSGRALNLASRLMDLARPSGVVFDGTFGFELLDENVQQLFVEEAVYVKSLAEDDPITVYCLRDAVTIPQVNKSPMNQLTRFTEETETMTFRQFQDRGPYRHILTREPARTDDIEVHISWPQVRSNKTKHPTLWTFDTAQARYMHAANQHIARVDYRPVQNLMRELGVKGTWPVQLVVEYSVPEAPPD
jgi:class 3 adenylate cyclase